MSPAHAHFPTCILTLRARLSGTKSDFQPLRGLAPAVLTWDLKSAPVGCAGPLHLSCSADVTFQGRAGAGAASSGLIVEMCA